MAYLERSDLTPGRIKPDFFASALDDDRDGIEDVGLADAVMEKSSEEVDGYLSRYSPPLTNPPALVKAAAVAFAGFEVYRRAGHEKSPENPFAEDRAYYRKQLEAIARGELNLGALDQAAGGGKVAIISEPAKTHSTAGDLLF
jgi:phage gp36-like protein